MPLLLLFQALSNSFFSSVKLFLLLRTLWGVPHVLTCMFSSPHPLSVWGIACFLCSAPLPSVVHSMRSCHHSITTLQKNVCCYVTCTCVTSVCTLTFACICTDYWPSGVADACLSCCHWNLNSLASRWAVHQALSLSLCAFSSALPLPSLQLYQLFTELLYVLFFLWVRPEQPCYQRTTANGFWRSWRESG